MKVNEIMQNHKDKNMLWVGIPLIAILLIFHNSMYPIAQSDFQSGFFQRVLNLFFSKIGYNIVFSQFMVRKLAHFIEYFCFGFLLTVTVWMIGKKRNGFFFFELFLFLAVPVLDETIQLFYQGRTSSVLDVLIDFSGCVIGMGLCRLIRRVFSSNRKDSQHFRES